MRKKIKIRTLITLGMVAILITKGISGSLMCISLNETVSKSCVFFQKKLFMSDINKQYDSEPYVEDSKHTYKINSESQLVDEITKKIESNPEIQDSDLKNFDLEQCVMDLKNEYNINDESQLVDEMLKKIEDNPELLDYILKNFDLEQYVMDLKQECNINDESQFVKELMSEVKENPELLDFVLNTLDLENEEFQEIYNYDVSQLSDSAIVTSLDCKVVYELLEKIAFYKELEKQF